MSTEAIIEPPPVEIPPVETPPVETPPVETPPVETPPAADAPEWFPKKYVKDGKPDHEALAKGYKELETKLGKGLAADVPAAPEGYQLKPEKLPEGITWSDDSAAKFATVFHANGISPTAAKGIVDTFLELEAQNLQSVTKAYDDQLKADKVALESEWGGAEGYQKQAGKISGLVIDALGEDPGDALLFSNPRIMRFLGKVVDQLGEDAQAALKGGVAPGSAFTDGTSLAKKIMSDPTHAEHAAYLAGEPAVIAKVQRLLDGGS
jgi:hypothetical protein